MGNNLSEVDLGTGFNVARIAVGELHACAVSTLNKLKCWGENNYGELGYGDRNDRGDGPGEMGNNLLPEVDLGTGFNVARIAVGELHACAVSTLNKLKCWGENNYGELGYGDRNDRGDGPGEMGNNLSEVDLGTGFTAIGIVSGEAHRCAVSALNTIKCWGGNNLGQLGYGDTNTRGGGPGEMGNNLPEVDLGTGFNVT
eukprot:401691_1